MTQTQTRPGRGWLRRLVIVGIALVLLLLLVRTGVDLWASRRVSAQVAKLEAQHGSLDVSTLRVPPVPEEENRARAMRAAAALVVEATEAVSGGLRDRAALSRFVAQRGPTPIPEDMKAFVEANRAAIRVAHEARDRRLSNWETDYSAGTNTPGLLEIRRLSDALYLSARLDLDAGRVDDAASSLSTGLALSASLRQEPSLITQLIRSAVALQHFEGVQRLLTESEPSESALEMLATALAENRTPAPMHIGLIGELKTFHTSLGRSVDGEGGWWPGQVSWFSRPLFRVAHAQYLEGIGRLLDLELGPRPRPAVSTKEPSKWSLVPGGIASGTAGLERALETGDLHGSALAMTELAVALRRFRLAHGAYPDALAALAPEYIARVPSDPLAGKPPVYVRQGVGFTLHSEGAKDDKPMHAAAVTWNVAR